MAFPSICVILLFNLQEQSPAVPGPSGATPLYPRMAGVTTAQQSSCQHTLLCSLSLTSSNHSPVSPYVLDDSSLLLTDSKHLQMASTPSTLAACSQTLRPWQGSPVLLCPTAQASVGAVAPVYMRSWPEVTMLPFKFLPCSCRSR